MQNADSYLDTRPVYPSHLVRCWRLIGGRRVTVRPVQPEDEELEQSFVRSLSSRTRYYRFFNAVRELAPETLWRLTHVDYQRSMTLLAVVHEAGREIQVGMAQYVSDGDTDACDFALVVQDGWQGRGVGSLLIDTLEQCASAAGLGRLNGDVITENQAMLRLARSRGFATYLNPEDARLMRVSKTLAATAGAPSAMPSATRVPCSS
jgi:acetyltransferase